jgi:hypothetical protein
MMEISFDYFEITTRLILRRILSNVAGKRYTWFMEVGYMAVKITFLY